MGAYDPTNSKRELERDQHPWIPPLPMNGGVVVGGGSGGGGMNDLADRLGGLAVRDVPDDSLIQVMRAVEDAENTIRKQLEENNQLKNELIRKTREIERYRLETATARPLEVLSDDNTIEPSKNNVSISSSRNEADTNRWLDNSSSISPQHMLIIHQNGVAEREESSVEAKIRNQHYYEPSSNPGSLRKIPGAQYGADSAGPSQLSTPSSRSLSPKKHRKDGELDSRFNFSASGLIPVSENNSNILWKQELIYKVREHEEEIAQLRKHLADYSVKEAQIRNEKYVLEKRIAYMRMAFDQQQQVLVDAASKAISYRQEIIEENIRLTYALEAAQAERSTFVSSLLPLLSEYRLEPAVHDAQSIVRNLKVLLRHMQEKLIFAEEKLKESQYQLTPWHPESSNITRTSPQSPSHPLNAPVSKNSLELVPQTAYQHASSPTSSPANYETRRDWEVLDNHNQQTGPSSSAANNSDLSSVVKTSLSASRNITTEEASAPVNQSQPHADRFSFESGDQNPSYKDLVRVNKTDDSETSGTQHERESSMQWAPRNSPYLASGQDDPSSYHYLPPVLEEPTSSFSEAADDDPLPAIEGLRISGDAYPGRELQASGYSINGTTSCNFEWVRFLEDGSVNYIDGAKPSFWKMEYLSVPSNRSPESSSLVPPYSFGVPWPEFNEGLSYADAVRVKKPGLTLIEFYSSKYQSSAPLQGWIHRIQNDQITVDGEVTTDPNTILRDGSRLTYNRLPWKEPFAPYLLEVLYEDDDLVAINKPSGLQVLPGGLFQQRTVLMQLQWKEWSKTIFSSKNMIKKDVHPAPVHRLGRGTSGVLLCAKTKQAKTCLAAYFAKETALAGHDRQLGTERKISKYYRALVSGLIDDNKVVIKQPIGLMHYPGVANGLYAALPSGKPAMSKVSVLERDIQQNQTIVQVEIHSGRPHQIRIHLAYIGHPLIGDPLYDVGGQPKLFTSDLSYVGFQEDGGYHKPAQPVPGDCGYYLHAHQLFLYHPTTNQKIEMIAPLPTILQTQEEQSLLR